MNFRTTHQWFHYCYGFTNCNQRIFHYLNKLESIVGALFFLSLSLFLLFIRNSICRLRIKQIWWAYFCWKHFESATSPHNIFQLILKADFEVAKWKESSNILFIRKMKRATSSTSRRSWKSMETLRSSVRPSVRIPIKSTCFNKLTKCVLDFGKVI